MRSSITASDTWASISISTSRWVVYWTLLILRLLHLFHSIAINYFLLLDFLLYWIRKSSQIINSFSSGRYSMILISTFYWWEERNIVRDVVVIVNTIAWSSVFHIINRVSIVILVKCVDQSLLMSVALTILMLLLVYFSILLSGIHCLLHYHIISVITGDSIIGRTLRSLVILHWICELLSNKRLIWMLRWRLISIALWGIGSSWRMRYWFWLSIWCG